MALIDEPIITSTVSKIFERYENDQDGGLREHLGASLIGEPCQRKLWYGFRWARKNRFSGRMLRLFETGQLEEARFVNDLRLIGVEVQEIDAGTGGQFRVSAHGGHFGGSLDGLGLGLVEAPKTWHVLEFKTHSAKSFKEMQEKKVEKAKPLHFAQMQVYMGLKGLDRAYYLARNKDTDDLYGERIHYNKEVFEALMAKAGNVIFAQYAPPKIHESPSWYMCKFCDYSDICHNKALPEVNCRTCLHSTPESTGKWSCAKWALDSIKPENQKKGCGSQLFIPSFIGEPQDAGENYVQYKDGQRNLAGGVVV